MRETGNFGLLENEFRAQKCDFFIMAKNNLLVAVSNNHIHGVHRPLSSPCRAAAASEDVLVPTTYHQREPRMTLQ
jgi:hypothetical protein